MFKQLPLVLFMLLCCFILLCCTKVLSQKNLELAANGTSNYTIVIPSDANDIEKQSASVLQSYLLKMSGCTLPIVAQPASVKSFQIIIGRNANMSISDTSGLGNDGILIKRVNNALILTGGARKGVLYSVYTLLEDYLGCRMYTSKVEDIPKKSTISLPASIYKKQTPSFDFRMTYFEDQFKNNYCDFHKLNYWLEDWGLWVHSFDQLMPKEKYFGAHPEYYSLVNNKRIPDQLCLTNPDVLALVVQNLKQLIKEKPTAKYWSVSQNDNINFCQCDRCRKADSLQGSHQGSLLAFVNNVAKQFPDKTITTLAYQYSEIPPKTLKPLSNVMIMLCTASQQRGIPVSEETGGDFNANFQKWSQITQQLFLWNYIVQFSNALSPFPNLNVLQPDIKYFASKNVTSMFEQGIGDIPGEFSELRCYMVSRLMWNKDADINAAMQEFINGYYGKKAAQYINQYITLINKNASLKPIPLRSGGTPMEAWDSYLSPQNIQAYKDLFSKALSATEGTPCNTRVLREYICVLYGELEVKRAELSRKKQSGAINRSEYLSLLDDYYKKVKQAQVTYLNESRMKVDDYYNNYNRVINEK